MPQGRLDLQSDLVPIFAEPAALTFRLHVLIPEAAGGWPRLDGSISGDIPSNPQCASQPSQFQVTTDDTLRICPLGLPLVSLDGLRTLHLVSQFSNDSFANFCQTYPYRFNLNYLAP